MTSMRKISPVLRETENRLWGCCFRTPADLQEQEVQELAPTMGISQGRTFWTKRTVN